MNPSLGVWLFVAANVVIALGYLYAGVRVAPHFVIPSKPARVAGVLFFALCAYTHGEQAVHALDDARYPGLANAADDPHMLLPHVAQAVAIWTFLLGIRRFIVRLGTQDLDQRIAYAFTADPFWRKQSVADVVKAPGVDRRVGKPDRRA